MKTLLAILLAATICTHAESAIPSADAHYLTEYITDRASRELILDKLDPLPPGSEGLAQRVEFRLPENTVAKTEIAAWEIIGRVTSNLALVSNATGTIRATDRRLDAEKDLSRILGIVPSREEENDTAARRMIALHHRELSREVFPWRNYRLWHTIRKNAPDKQQADRTLSELINSADIPWITDLLCHQLNEYDKIIQYGLTDMSFADSEVNILAHTLCLALGTRYSARPSGWGPNRLKRFAVKQLKRSAKRPNIAPAEAKVISSAIHQLETFQPDPMNQIIL